MTDNLIRPRLVAGLAAIPADDALIVEGLIVDGSPQRRLFSGTAALSLLPQLLPLLDGRHDLDALAAATGITTDQAAQAVALLARSGLLSNGPSGSAVEVFLDRTSRSPQRALARLAEATVAVALPEQLTDMIVADLTATGIETIHRGLTTDADLVIADDAHLDGFTEPALRVSGLEIGPFVNAVDTVCSECAATSQATDPHTEPDPPAAQTVATASMLCSLAVAEVLATFTDGTSAIGRGKLVVDATDLSCETVDVHPRAYCPRCTLVDDSVFGCLEWLNRGHHAGSGRIRTQTHTDLATSPRRPHTDVPEPVGAILAALAADPTADVYLIGSGLDHPIHRHSPDALIATRADLTEVPRLNCLPPDPLAVAVVVAAPDRWIPKFGPQALRRAFLAAGRALARLPEGPSTVTATWFDAELSDLLELHADREATAAVIGIYAGPFGKPAEYRGPAPGHATDQPQVRRQTMPLTAISAELGAAPLHSGRPTGEGPNTDTVTRILDEIDYPLTVRMHGRRILLGGKATASAADFRAACVSAGLATARLADRLGGMIDDQTTAWPVRGEIVHLTTLTIAEEA